MASEKRSRTSLGKPMRRDIHLTRELVDQIVFGMENQDQEFYLDLETQTVVPDPPDIEEEAERYVDLPPWSSVDGYNLMERFVGSLRNPIYRERLRKILASGRGVFRQFKQTVSERDDIEKLWFGFKQKEMSAVVAEWANDLRELWGLERQELSDAEETLPLIATDFVISEAQKPDLDRISALDRVAFAENFPEDSQRLVDLLYRHHRRAIPIPDHVESECLVARTPGEELAAFLWAVLLRDGGLVVPVVVQLFVMPEYRGLGLAKALLREHLVRGHKRGYAETVLNLAGSAFRLEKSLSEEGFVPESISMRVSHTRWFRENEEA